MSFVSYIKKMTCTGPELSSVISVVKILKVATRKPHGKEEQANNIAGEHKS